MVGGGYRDSCAVSFPMLFCGCIFLASYFLVRNNYASLLIKDLDGALRIIIYGYGYPKAHDHGIKAYQVACAVY